MNQDIKELRKKLNQFENEHINSSKKVSISKYSNISIVYNIFADLLGGILTAFILNKIYTYFFGKSVLVLALLLIICSIAGLYNTIRLFWKR